MEDRDYEIDLEMLGDFIDESLEALATIPGLFVALEANPNQLNLLEEVFRPIHSLKGNAAYFGLMKVKALAHDLETVMDLLRKRVILPDRRIVDLLLASIDELANMLELTRSNGSDTMTLLRDELLGSLRDLTHQQRSAPIEQVEAPPLNWEAVLADLEALAALPELSQGEARIRVDSLRTRLHALAHKDLSAPPPAPAPSACANPLAALEQLLLNKPADMSLAREGELVKDYLGQLAARAEFEDAKQAVAKCMDEFETFVNSIGYDPMLRDFMIEGVETLRDLQDWSAPEPPPPPPPVAAVKPAAMPETAVVEEEPEAEEVMGGQRGGKSKDTSRTMRISEERVDAFLSYVGELIAVDEMLRYIHSEMDRREVDPQVCHSLLSIVNTFSKLSNDLQSSIMSIRRVSVRPLLQKAQRIVRDLTNENGKLVDTVIKGEEITIDRSLMETLEVAVVHMVRNAVDHGVETSAERLASGKSERARVTVSMSEADEMIILSIADDGKGLNYASIQQKAVRMGLLKRGVPVTEDVLVDVIFASGFSTAEAITDISGRGVGMDAVKRTVEDSGGSITVHTVPGKGTEFRVSVPKSVGTQILDSFVVQVGEDRFVLPMERIAGSFKPVGEFTRLPGGAVCVRRLDTILPVICLEGPYTGSFERLEQGLLVRIEDKFRPFVFYVDNILGMQKVVLRSIPWINAEKFMGAAIMGDGRVSMIVDIEQLAKLAAR